MEPYRDDNELMTELRGLRPEPRQEFTAELDERAAAGFPRRSSRESSSLQGLASWLRAVPPRRLMLSAGATALATVAVATVIVAATEPETEQAPIAAVRLSEHSPTLDRLAAPSRGETSAGEVGHSALPSKSRSGDDSGHQSVTAQPTTPTETKSFKQFSGVVPSSGGVSSGASGTTSAGTELSLKSSNSSFNGSGPYASRARSRDVERSAEMVLGADPDEVAGDAAEVFDAVHAANGIVLSSSVSGGAEGDAGARFELLIPAAKLGDALADFSAIATVVSRHEATDDITAPTVRIAEHLRDSRATIDGLLVQLAGADTDEERAEVEAELRAERRHAASLRSQASKLDRRANLSRVSLRIVTGSGAASSDQSGDWGIGDALDDAGHILAIAAGVTIVGLAIIGPLALIALLGWLANRARIRRGRERALT
jgi:hypothetical protein